MKLDLDIVGYIRLDLDFTPSWDIIIKQDTVKTESSSKSRIPWPIG